MTDRPIIFSAPMVRALLDGRKTMTRRIMNLPTKSRGGRPIYEHPKMGGWEPTTIGGGGCFKVGKGGERIPVPEQVAIWHRTCGDVIVPKYQPGDRLWVRENWSHNGIGVWTICDARMSMGGKPLYAADGGSGPWWPSIHMPREFSRLTLIVTAVKVERLQEISEADAVAEGVVALEGKFSRCYSVPGADALSGTSARDCFARLWTSLHGDEAWAANPFVVAISFSVIKQNIDTLPKAEAA